MGDGGWTSVPHLRKLEEMRLAEAGDMMAAQAVDSVIEDMRAEPRDELSIR